MVGSGLNECEGRKGIDATVGGLVWVRRRNGSWWPGQIVGHDELPENGLTCTRSGTPIKLLCRDDSSVEWYDLEKTKGVKAFRCGDYDSCIEKAKASTTTTSKRSVKYPRRENAIICALEIERTNLFKDCPNLQSEETSSDQTSSPCEKNPNSTHELTNSVISYEGTNGSTFLKELPFKKRKKTPNDSEDDGNEGIKRMKGLDDLGIGVGRKVRVLALANPVPQSSESPANSRSANSRSANYTSLGSVTLKRKRSQVVHIHELLKRKYRRRPLTKVLENTTMVPVRIICDEFATPFERSDAISPTYEWEDGYKAKDTELFNVQLPEDDSLFDVPFIDEDLQLSGFSPTQESSLPSKPRIVAFHGDSTRNFQVRTSSFGHKALNESVPVNSSVTRVDQKVVKTASKWQSKGKRKARHLSKTEEPNKSDAYTIGLVNQSRFSPSSNGFINRFSDRRKHIYMVSSQRSFSYHQPRFFVHTSFEIPDVPSRGIHADTSLYEVEITVEATRPQAQQVPYISLMSKLNGKPITGHPVAVEVLEDGYCDLQTSDYPASGSCELDDDDTDTGFTIDPRACRSKHVILQPGSKKPSKSKKHGPSSKKTRKLSSLTSLNLGKSELMGLNPKGPTLACVPLKVVFSRINEALNGSTRSTHNAATLNNT